MSAVTSSPLDSRPHAGLPGSKRAPTIPFRIRSSAPKRSACRPARRASSAPPMPSTKPKKFSISEVCEAWPPGRSCSETAVERPSDAPYTAAASPAGPPPTIIRS
jgi:hypothetical protein